MRSRSDQAPTSSNVVPRPRLTSLLRGRFDHRLTLLTGPGGAGKTTLLALAMDDNRLDPFGIDVWISATAYDQDRAHFTSRIAAALGLPEAKTWELTASDVSSAVWSMAPRDVVIVIDDVHLIETSASEEVLSTLLRDLPSNGHLLLAGRTQPKLPAARLRAHGEVLEIDVDDLGFDDEELAALIDLRLQNKERPSTATVDLPRLPALADLQLRVGPGAHVDFLWEEVLSTLEITRQQVLRAASVLDVVDDELVAALSDGSMTAAELTAGLPLVEHLGTAGAGHSFRLHAVLKAALRRASEPSELGDAARIAAMVELDRGNLRAATELFAEAGDVDAVADVARRFALLPGLRRAFQDQLVVRSVVETLCPGTPLAGLLRCESQFGELSTTTDITRLGRDLATVAVQARSVGDQELEAVALYRALVWISLDAPVPPELVDRLQELASSEPYACQSVRLVRAELAMFAGDPETSFELLGPVAVVDPDLELVDRSGLLCSLGRPEDVGVGLTTADLASMPEGAELYVGFALWNRGQLTPETALPIAMAMTADVLARRVVHPIVAILGVTSFMALALGDTDTATRHVQRAREESLYGCSAHIRAFTAMAAAATAVEVENEREAAELLRGMLDAIPIGRWPIRAYLLSLPMIYLLCPETREVLDGCRFGAALTIACQAARALVDVRENGSLDAAASLPWEREACLRAHLLPMHLCELAVAGAAAGDDRADQLLERLPRVRHCLERVAAVSSPQVVAAARHRLGMLPSRSLHQVSVRALGTLTVFRDGEPIVAADWERRTRVRELMGLLVDHRRVSRARVAATCWPDLDTDKALRNLRVTLAYLHRVLEPERAASARPTVVRAVGDQLVLDEEVVVDVDRFTQAMGRAGDHDRAGAPGVALGLYREALADYVGEYLADIDAEWLQPSRTKLHLLAIGGMLRVGELELASGEPDRAAVWAARASALSYGNERAGRLHAACLLAVGDRVGAAHTLRQLVDIAVADRVEPEPETWRMLRRLDPQAGPGR